MNFTTQHVLCQSYWRIRAVNLIARKVWISFSFHTKFRLLRCPAKREQPERFKELTWPRPKSGLDCLTYATIARCKAWGQLGQDEPASGSRWSHCSGSTARMHYRNSGSASVGKTPGDGQATQTKASFIIDETPFRRHVYDTLPSAFVGHSLSTGMGHTSVNI